ncbi:unnamed protein product [Mucor fragilis]
MVATLIFVIVFYLLICGHVHGYYGDIYNRTFDIPLLFKGVSVAVEDTIYILGGINIGHTSDASYPKITTLRFDSQQNAITSTITNTASQLNRELSHAYALGDNKTIVLANVQYPNFNAPNAQGNATIELRTSGLSFYDIPTNTWTNPQLNAALQPLPPLRKAIMSAISPENDAIYVMGGVYPIDGTPMPDIFRYDLKNTSSIINMTAVDANLKIDTVGASSQMLPNGVVVIAFGEVSVKDKTLVDTSHVTLFDTRKNQIYTQNVAGIVPPPRHAAGSALGPDKSTIYYYGGGDEASLTNLEVGNAVPGLVALDTTTWTWLQLDIPGPPSAPFIYSTLTLLQNTKLVVALGLAESKFTTDIGVIVGVPQSSDERQNSKMHWFTNNDSLDQTNSRANDDLQRLSEGAVAGIVVAVLLVFILLLALLWRRFPRVWRAAVGRVSSPSASLYSTVSVLVFVVYSIYRSIDSPVVVQEVRESTNIVRAPDVRFCFSGFSSRVYSMSWKISCTFRNGTDCSSQILQLDNARHTPNFPDLLGNSPVCYMFVSTPAYSFFDGNSAYNKITGSKMVFRIQGPPSIDSNGDAVASGIMYVDMYAPDYNPNMDAYRLGLPTKVGPEEYREWLLEEQNTNLVSTIIAKAGVRSTALYDIVGRKALRRNDDWNFVGFSSKYDETSTVNSFYRDTPQNIALQKTASLLAQLTIQPSSFTVNTSSEQKVFTLLNAFAQIGGVLGLFVAVQTILFGFRPQSPWGIVHRWSFGRLRIKLTNRLANYFDRMGTPVPLVSPVSNRLSTAFKNNTHSSDHALDKAMSQDDRVYQLEERLQMMELLLKSYYLNDEVFRSLDQAVKRGNDEKSRSSMRGIKGRSTDSALVNVSNEMLELSPDTKVDEESACTAGINRRPSGAVSPQQRGMYQLGPDSSRHDP